MISKRIKDVSLYEPSPQKAPPRKEDAIPEETLEKAYRYWTKQQEKGTKLVVAEKGKSAAGTAKRRTAKSVFAHSKSIKNMTVLYNYEKKLKVGSPRKIMTAINEAVLARFLETRAQHGIIHGKTA